MGFVDKERDVRNTSYKPVNALDEENHQLCMSFFLSLAVIGKLIKDATDDPELWHNAPISLQLVGRQFEDERLLAVGAVVDTTIKATFRS